MDTAEILVLVGGLALAAFVVWFFFGPRVPERAVQGAGGTQEIKITVQGGYSPDRIEVKRDRPVRLLFRREEANPCTEQVIFGDFGLSKMLPQGQTVPLEFTPHQKGEFTFHCGMNMVRGKLVVTE